MILPNKDPEERWPMIFDFSPDLAEISGTPTLTTVVTSCQLAQHSAATDPAPASVLPGQPLIVGGITAVQWIEGGVSGADYTLRAKGTCSDGSVIVLAGMLPVRRAA
jgi:hypothetical protein